MPIGSAKFGNGSGPANITTRLPQMLPSYYFRKTFFAASAEIEELLLSAVCTDVSMSLLYPPRVFLNGIEVKATIDVTTSQGNETRYFDLLPFAHLVNPGTNVLAVQLNNYWSDYDDIAFDISLKAVIHHPVLPRATLHCSPTNAPVVSVETAPHAVFSLLSSDALTTTNWQTMLVFTNLTGGLQRFEDTGQNNRLPPGLVPGRYYRVVPY